MRILLMACGVLGTVSCSLTPPVESRENFEARLDRQNANYEERMERRKMRQAAQDERYDLWWNKIMGR
ncbi:MAG: hypothetical protein RLZZ179_1661 [Verrucomicrobiota bacterium]|jgi:hypothetical protein